MKIKCDVCAEEFELKNQVEKYADGIEEVYFKCPHCKEKYTSYFTNKSIRIKQNKINKTIQELKKIMIPQELIELLKKVDNMKKEIKADMENLRKKMLGTQ